jgi:hypothetical protein
LFGKSDQCQAERLVILPVSGLVLMCRARQADRFAGSPFRCRQLLANIEDRLTQIGWRQAFGFK